MVSPPPHGLSRGKVALSASRTFAPGRREMVGGRRTGRPAADDEHVEALHDVRLQCARSKGVCPSGQRERAVNPSAQPTEVRILPPPSSSHSLCIRAVVLRRQYRSTRRPDGRTDLTTGAAAGRGRRRPRARSSSLRPSSARSSPGGTRFRGCSRTSTSTPRSAARSATAICRSAARPSISRACSSRSSPRRSGGSSRSRRPTTSSRSRTPSPPRSPRSRSTASPARSGSRRRYSLAVAVYGLLDPRARARRVHLVGRGRLPVGGRRRRRRASSASTSRRPRQQIGFLVVRQPRDARPRRVLRRSCPRTSSRPSRSIAGRPGDGTESRSSRSCPRSRVALVGAFGYYLTGPQRDAAPRELRQVVLPADVPARDRARRRDRAGRGRRPARPARGANVAFAVFFGALCVLLLDARRRKPAAETQRVQGALPLRCCSRSLPIAFGLYIRTAGRYRRSSSAIAAVRRDRRRALPLPEYAAATFKTDSQFLFAVSDEPEPLRHRPTRRS